jgi:hypothetical protein
MYYYLRFQMYDAYGKLTSYQGVVLKIDFEKAYDSVRGTLWRKCWQKKGFCDQLKEWIMSARGGGVGININGRRDRTSRLIEAWCGWLSKTEYNLGKCLGGEMER